VAGSEQIAQDLVSHSRTVTLRKSLQSLEDTEVGADRVMEFLVEDSEVLITLVGEQAPAVDFVTGAL